MRFEMGHVFLGAVLLSATGCVVDITGATCVTSADCPRHQTCLAQGAKRTCQFVDGGESTGDDGGTSDAGADAGGAPFRAFNLVFPAAALPVACFKSGVLPPNATLPARTIEVLIWQASMGRKFIALAEFGTLQLGEAPTLRVPAAVEGSNGTFQTSVNVQRPVTDQYTEARQTTARFVFADLAAATTTGTLELSAQFACIIGRAACPTGAAAPADTASCTLTIPFSTQEVPLSAKWTTPQDPRAGAEKYLVATDPTPLLSLAVPSCWRNNNLPAGQVTTTITNGRSLDLWQVFDVGGTRTLRTAHQVWQLGSAPTVTLNTDLADVAGTFLATTSQQTPNGTLWVESRATRIAVPGFTGTEAATRLELLAQYACAAGTMSCPVGDMAPADAASCQLGLDGVALKLP